MSVDLSIVAMTVRQLEELEETGSVAGAVPGELLQVHFFGEQVHLLAALRQATPSHISDDGRETPLDFPDLAERAVFGSRPIPPVEYTATLTPDEVCAVANALQELSPEAFRTVLSHPWLTRGKRNDDALTLTYTELRSFYLEASKRQLGTVHWIS